MSHIWRKTQDGKSNADQMATIGTQMSIAASEAMLQQAN